MKLTPKQKKFCEYYASSGNATKSATKAGYSEKTAYSQGQRLLKGVEIQKYLKILTKKDEEKRIMSIQERQEWLTKIIEGKINEINSYLEDGKLREVEIKPKLDTLLKASEQLNKMQGAYLERVENSGGIKIIMEESVKEISE